MVSDAPSSRPVVSEPNQVKPRQHTRREKPNSSVKRSERVPVKVCINRLQEAAGLTVFTESFIMIYTNTQLMLWDLHQ